MPSDRRCLAGPMSIIFPISAGGPRALRGIEEDAREARRKSTGLGELETCGDQKRPREMAGSPLLRWVPVLAARLRLQPRLLATSSAVQPSAALESPDAVHMTQNCIRRLKELHEKETSAEGKMLRLSVETGGCSGFQYAFSLDDKKNEDDRIFETGGVKLVVDNVSYDFVKGATVDYVEELIRSAFLVMENPSAVGGCSCKSSFMVNQ